MKQKAFRTIALGSLWLCFVFGAARRSHAQDSNKPIRVWHPLTNT